jgi:serine beta-lactamase-like protein LACTB, mitochondrial
MKKILLIFFLGVIGLSIQGQRLESQANDRLQVFVATNEIPGLSISISQKGELIYSRGFGFEDLENQLPVDPSKTKFRIGSVSKTLTAAGLALLYQQGKVDLDIPIEKYVPSWPKKAATITLRQLGGHIAGIRHYQASEFYSSENYPSVTAGLDIFINDPLINIPGTAYVYSSYGWNLIATAMEYEVDVSFLEFMEQEVFDRLNMEHTVAERMTSEISHKAKFYEKEGKTVVPAAYVDNSYKWAGGGFLSTTEDLCRFGQAHLKAGFLKQSTLDEWMQSQKTSDGKETDYGIGWRTYKRVNGRLYYGHSGGSVGSTTYLLIHQASETVLAITSNLSPLSYDELPFDLMDLFTSQ